MMRDVNPSGKFQSFIGEQPRKLAGKSLAKHKKIHSHSALLDADDFSRGRDTYHRAASKNIAREILLSGQF